MPWIRLTFRTDKSHKVQESGKADRNAFVLASRLQRFLTTGKLPKKDLKTIDVYFATFLKDQAKRSLELLERLSEHIPKSKGKETLDSIRDSWNRWISALESGEVPGYSGIHVTRVEQQNVMLEEIVDIDTDLTRMLMTLNTTLTTFLRQSSYEVPNVKQLSESFEEVLKIYDSRSKLLAKFSS